MGFLEGPRLRLVKGQRWASVLGASFKARLLGRLPRAPSKGNGVGRWLGEGGGETSRPKEEEREKKGKEKEKGMQKRRRKRGRRKRKR